MGRLSDPLPHPGPDRGRRRPGAHRRSQPRRQLAEPGHAAPRPQRGPRVAPRPHGADASSRPTPRAWSRRGSRRRDRPRGGGDRTVAHQRRPAHPGRAEGPARRRGHPDRRARPWCTSWSWPRCAGSWSAGRWSASQQAFVLVRDWLGTQPAVDRDVALAELARRYLVGHGPATDRDLARWSGLGLRDARSGLRAIADELDEASDGSVDLKGRRPVAELPPPKLLGPFDPLLLGWVSRDAIVGSHRSIVTTNGLFRAVRAGRRQGGRHLVAGGRAHRAGPLRPPLEGDAAGPRCGRRRRAALPRRRAVSRPPKRGLCRLRGGGQGGDVGQRDER